MRWIVHLILFLIMSVSAAGQAPLGFEGVAGAGDGLFQYRFDTSARGYSDVVTLKGGRRDIGKALEWAYQVLVFKPDGRPTVYSAADVKEIEFRRVQRHVDCPMLPDLTVAYVERLPRETSWHGRLKNEGGLLVPQGRAEDIVRTPAAGTKTTFRVHVLNAGKTASAEVSCIVSLDGRALTETKVGPLEPGRSQPVETTWDWQDGSHVLRVELDREGRGQEHVRWNNTFEEAVDGQAVAVVVSADRYETYRRHANLVDTFCFEDWVQYHLRCAMGLMRASVYPSSPKGVEERIRCDRILVVEDAERTADWMLKLRHGGREDGVSEASAVLVFGRSAADLHDPFATLKVEWPALKELGLQLGLIDLTTTDTRPGDCLVMDFAERYFVGQHLFPNPATLMYAPGPFLLTELEVAYLNAARGKPRGFQGEYLLNLPEHIVLDLRSNAGRPIAGVQVDGFALQHEGEFAGAVAGAGTDPLYSATTDESGRVELPNLPTPTYSTPNGYTLRPNAFGKIASDGSNGLLLLRMRQTQENETREEFHFLRLTDCHLAWLRGDRDRYDVHLLTRFPEPDAPLPPPFTLATMDPRDDPLPNLLIQWRTRVSLLEVEEFRIYKRFGLGADSETPWTLASAVRKVGKQWSLDSPQTYFDPPSDLGRYSPDTRFTITTVDKRGRESGLANPCFIPYRKSVARMAIDTELAFITLTGDGPVQMLRWDTSSGSQPFVVQPRAVRGYTPSFGGIAVTPDHRLVMTDPRNHVIGFYDLSGNLERVSPMRPRWPGFPSDDPGAFYDPADVAVGKDGRIYVADRGNARVQVLSAQGDPLGVVDEGFGFILPHAVAVSNGRLCVTDNAGTRLRIYKLDGEKPMIERQITTLEDADRALVSKSGKVYVTARDLVSDKRGVMVFEPQGEELRKLDTMMMGEMGKIFDPVSAYLYDFQSEDYLYLVNTIPFDLRRIQME
jgi:DNA-binding beta-propeller fold protein YncE